MLHNVLKLSKPNSQPSIYPISSTHSLHHPQNHFSIDYPKERDSVSNSKDHSNSQSGIKKLAVLLNPRKERGLTLQDIHNSISPNHTSPKSFLEASNKLNKLRASTSSHENQNFNLVSPKDLVRLAMSKHKSKANLKKVSNPTSSNPRNTRKSHSLRYGPGMIGLEKCEGSSKVISNSIMDESGALSRTSLASKDKTAKLRRMKQIYNDMTSTEIGRQTKSIIYTNVNDTSGRVWQDSVSPKRSNSGNLLTASPAVLNSVTNQHNNSKSRHYLIAQQKEEKGQKSNRKKSSIEPERESLKDYKTSTKQAKRNEKKAVQTRKTPSAENRKPHSLSFTRLMSHPTLHLGEKSRSPVKKIEREVEMLEQSHEKVGKETKPRVEFIADLKSWVNDIAKPGEQKIVVEPAPQQQQQTRKNSGPAEKVKEVQEGLLEKLRDVLENDEFVRREDYERLYREKDGIEEELDEVKEENSKLREIIWQMQQEIEKKNVLPLNISMSDHEEEFLETISKLRKELEIYKKREKAVKDVVKLIWKTGVEIGELGFDEDIQEVNEKEEDEYAHHAQKFDQNDENPQNFYHNNHYNVHEEFTKNHNDDDDDGMYFKIYDNGIPEQREDPRDNAASEVVKALSELDESESALIEKNLDVESLPMNLQSGKKIRQSKSAEIGGKSNSTGKLKIDLRGLGGNLTIPKKQTSLPCNKSADKNNRFIVTDEAQALGFHQEFMSKLEEFSMSWRQAALSHQKF